MNIIDKIKLNFYPELKQSNINEEILKQIISNKNFNAQYKSNIKPFIKYLRGYEYSEFDNGTLTKCNLSNDIIKQHLKAAFELSINNNSNKYISAIKKYNFEKNNITNFYVFSDQNFEKIYSLIDYDIFKENISKIINSGYSDRLLYFISNNNKISLEKIDTSLFDDKVWNIISQNSPIANTTVLDLFNCNMNVLVDLINKDLFEGIKYTYENIPESHNFIECQLNIHKEGEISFQQFSMEFIKNIGDETLNKLYKKCEFIKKNEFKKIFEISSLGNYELIKDIVNFDSYDFSFKSVNKDDMQKQLLETEIHQYNKKEVFLNKYFNVARGDAYYIKLFLDSLSKVNDLPEEFKEKYGCIIELLNKILNSTDEELINISKTINLDKRNEYKKLIESCEKDGNDVLRNYFVNDLKIKNQQIVSTAEHKVIITKDGNTINVYELSGQPFTMLVHAVFNNTMSIYNSYVSQIVKNPENWNKIGDGNNYISTSLISDKYMVTYGSMPNSNDIVMFGFNNLPYECLIFNQTMDAGTNRNSPANCFKNYSNRNSLYVSEINTVTTVDDLMEKTIKSNLRKQPNSRLWNEIVLSRTDTNTGMKIKPNFVVCMDKISENSIKAAQQFNIPIYLINCKYYPELPYINGNVFDNTPVTETANLTK